MYFTLTLYVHSYLKEVIFMITKVKDFLVEFLILSLIVFIVGSIIWGIIIVWFNLVFRVGGERSFEPTNWVVGGILLWASYLVRLWYIWDFPFIGRRY